MTSFRRSVGDVVGQDLIIAACLPKGEDSDFPPGTPVIFANQEVVGLAAEEACHGWIVRHERFTVNNGHQFTHVRLKDRGHTLADIYSLPHWDEDPLPTLEIPPCPSLWMHRNGDVYELYDITNEASTRLDEYPISVSYRRLRDGSRWSKSLRGFLKARTRLPNDFDFEAYMRNRA